MNQTEIQEGALEFIASNNTMVVATSNAQGVPQAATVHFLVDDQFNLYFATGKETTKAKNLSSSKYVAFVIGTGPKVITVQGGGKVEELTGEHLMASVGSIGKELYDRATNEWPVLKLGHTGIAFFKIKPEWMVWLSLDKEGYPESYSPDYHKVI